MSSKGPEYVDVDPMFYNEPVLVPDWPPPPSTERRNSQSPGSTSASGSDGSATPQDRREKIARRMMPAAMLKRLEREYAEKERRKADRKSRQERLGSHARPGKAVTRRGEGDVNIDDLFEEVASEEEAVDLPQARSASPSPRMDRQQQLIVISDDESSGFSQAREDDRGELGLARLYRGDFESIVGGKKFERRLHRRLSSNIRPQNRHSRKRCRRPTLGIVHRTRQFNVSGNQPMFQTRLDFQTHKTLPAHRSKTKKPEKKDEIHQSRPAIRLDDHIIFATTDFAFDVQEVENSPHSSRVSNQTTSVVVSEPDALDLGIGKARSWANFDRFPIDFGISPLPSGLYCDPESLVGNGELFRLVSFLRGDYLLGDRDIPACSAYGVELQSDMSPNDLASVVSIVFQAVFASIVALANDSSADPPYLGPLEFFALYLSPCSGDLDDVKQLRSSCRAAICDFSDKLDDVAVANTGHGKPHRESLLLVRWSLLELAMRLSVVSSGEENMETLVNKCGTAIFRQLFSLGFDTTIRPLKLILRSQSNTPEIGELSAILWVALLHALPAWNKRRADQADIFSVCLDQALDLSFRLDQTGPIAAERVWFLIFGLCALSQFDVHGRIVAGFTPAARWGLVRRAVSLIKISHNEDAEEKAHLDQLRGRDRYIKAMIARCVRLSSVWRWSFDRESFSVVTKGLGTIFKDRQHRNLPTEAPVDYPDWVTSFDVSLTAAEDSKHESAFDLYLRLVCVGASDIIASAQSLSEAQQAEKDVQRLIMSTIPVSPVRFNRILPPTARQLGQLINRYSTVIAACYFSPSLLTWLLANCRKWSSFEQADFESRQVCVRGLMYVAVACRHHQQPLHPIVARLADLLGILQQELDDLGKAPAPARAPSRVETERTMVLVVTCFRRMIVYHSFDVQQQMKPVYPEPCLLHESKPL